jgi:hypothetical protein
MRCRSCSPSVRRVRRVILWLGLLGLLLPESLAWTAAVGDQVELRAIHPAGVPLHRVPGGTQGVQRVPDVTVSTAMDTARAGRWLQIRPNMATASLTSVRNETDLIQRRQHLAVSRVVSS